MLFLSRKCWLILLVTQTRFNPDWCDACHWSYPTLWLNEGDVTGMILLMINSKWELLLSFWHQRWDQSVSQEVRILLLVRIWSLWLKPNQSLLYCVCKRIVASFLWLSFGMTKTCLPVQLLKFIKHLVFVLCQLPFPLNGCKLCEICAGLENVICFGGLTRVS